MSDSQATAMLSSFLLSQQARHHEADDAVSGSRPSPTSEADPLSGPQTLAAMRAAVQKGLALIHEKRLEQLLLMKSSHRSVRVISSYNHVVQLY